jgi:PLP dependent protein
MDSQFDSIQEAVYEISKLIPEHVTLLAAAKTRSLQEVEAVIAAGIKHIGYNYVQEALPIIAAVGDRARWHMIGHLQRNKVKEVVENFDILETLDSWRLAKELEKRCSAMDKTMPVLVEVNSGRESSKTGVPPGKVIELVEKVSQLEHLHIQGLMTMGPRFGDPQESRPYFQVTRKIFDELTARKLPNVEMSYLSMGMSNSYLVAIEEGANIVRIGTKLFGARDG